MTLPTSTAIEDVRNAIVEFVLDNFLSTYTKDTLPLEQSLLNLGVIDSYGVVELVSFMEETWSIAIPDSDITREKMGSIDKMAALVVSYKE